MVSMEPIECGARQSNSSEMECSPRASTSYGVYSPSQKDDVDSSLLSDHRAERERKWKADKQGQSRRRLNTSPGIRKSFEKIEAEDCGVTGSGKIEGKSSTLNQGRKKQKGRKSFASKVCLEQDLDTMPVESEASGDEDQDELSNSKTFERLVQLSELEEEVLLLHKRLAEELELRAVLETALEHASGTLTNFPRHLPISAQELLANITLLEVAVLKLEEQSSILQSEVGQARTEREIAELRHTSSSSESAHLGSEGFNLHSVSSESNRSREDDHTTRSPGRAPELLDQHLKASETRKSTELAVFESNILPDDAAPGRASDSSELQKPGRNNRPLHCGKIFV
ncbi:hypothetical protein KC19_N040500 [Ceratodon purpureus]|nr:hypothetical protein KC19_N040500 [Ceratodon purpureus]